MNSEPNHIDQPEVAAAAGSAKAVKGRGRDILWLLVGLVILGLMIGWAYWKDSENLENALWQASGQPLLLVAAMVLMLATLFCFQLKWQLMARVAGARVKFRQSLHFFSVLYLLGTFTPGRAGELAVPMLMSGGSRLMGVTLVNRLIESFWTLVIGLFVLAFVFAGDAGAMVWAWLALVLLGFVSVMFILSRRRLASRMIGLGLWTISPLRRVRLVDNVCRRCEAGLDDFYSANERLLRPLPILIMCLLMVGIWALMIGANWTLAQASVPTGPGDKTVTVLVIVAVITVNAVVMFLAPVPGGVGLSELSAMGVLTRLGYESARFLPFLILIRIVFLLAIAIYYALGRLLGQPLSSNSDQTELGEPAARADLQESEPSR